MFKKSISLLLLLFFTQTVLAGIDLHHGISNDNSFDIVDHYIDAHHSDAGTAHQYNIDTEKYSHKTGVNHDADNTSLNDDDFHHHGCHGHTTYYSFNSTSFLNIAFVNYPGNFNYILNENSITLSTAYRPPITS